MPLSGGDGVHQDGACAVTKPVYVALRRQNTSDASDGFWVCMARSCTAGGGCSVRTAP